MLKRREENNTFLTHVCRHCWGRKSPMTIDEKGAFSQHCGFHQSTFLTDKSHSVG